MKVSLNWIKKYVDIPAEISDKQIAYDLTLRTVEVEGVEDSKNKVMSIEFEPFTIIDQNTEDVYQKFIALMKKHGGRKNA